MRLKLGVSVLLAWSLLPLTGMAYDPKSHGEMSQIAADRSVVAIDPSTLQDLGLNTYNNASQTFRNSRGGSSTVRQLFLDGARFEDSDTRPTAHFYNPTTGLGILGFPPSPGWAIDGTGDVDTITFSFKAARQYLLNALTDPVQSFRNDRFGLTFESLGHVIHHLQDMAQPQHVRADLHCDSMVCRIVPGLYNPSLYESYTKDIGLAGLLLSLPGYPTVYGAADTSTFASPRNFWNTEPPGPGSAAAGKGIAEFTNRNFLSAGSNFDKPAQPSPPGFSLPAFDPSNNQILTVSQLCSPAAQCPASIASRPDEVVVFYGSSGHDNYLGTDLTNPRASTESIFDQYLVAQGQSRIFSLNRFNFDAAHTFLLPRAVAYSTGLVNYFFRGKIDYLPDPDNPGGFLVKNLGTEPMRGKFQVYYDDKTGTRHAVNGALWDTEVILAGDPDTPGVLAPGKGMPVPRIEQPTLPEPKTIGEFMLVFAGEMGQERPENGSVGAVVGKVIQGIPYRGELYVAGLDAQNRVVTFKVDPSGLRVLNGFDASGQFHSTPATWNSQTQTDIDPLLPVVNAFNAGVQTKVLRMKQSTFQPAVLGGMSHQLNAVSFPLSFGSFRAYVRDPVTGRLNFKDTMTRWTASHPDPTVGWFEFRPDFQSGLGYTRTYRPSPDQNLLSVSGSVPLQASPQLIALVFDSFNRGEAIASPDGLTVSGIKGSSGTDATNSTWDTYEVRITLGTAPTATVVQSESVLQIAQNVVSPNNVYENTVAGPFGSTYDYTYTTHYRRIDDGERIDNDRRTFEDYIAGNLVTWRNQTHGSQTIEESSDGTTHSFYVPAPPACPNAFTQDTQINTQATSRTIYTTTAQLDQPVVWTLSYIPKQDPAPLISGNYTRTYASHETDIIGCPPSNPTAPRNDIPGTPVIQDNYVFAPDATEPNNTPTNTGTTIYHSLTGKVDGTILYDHARFGFVFNGTFLGQPNTNFIADSSPLGEVFLAMTDKSTIIYQPLPSSRMPAALQIPTNIIKLIAAIWL